MASPASEVIIDGRTIHLSNLDAIVYPSTGTTKAEVIDYYSRIAPVLLPHLAERPVTRKRWVRGVGTAEEPGDAFFQKNLDSSTPEWVHRRTIHHKDHDNDYPIVGDTATLVWLAQLSALELHVPQWRFGPAGEQLNPDRLVLDLDPGSGAGLRECAEVAGLARELLLERGLDPVPVTSGSKGIHLYAALDGSRSSDAITALAKELAASIEASHPALAVSNMRRTLREGRVLVDWSQNRASKTTVTPYSLRGRVQPFVAAPRTWDELGDAELRQLDFREVLDRVTEHGDPLAAAGIG